MNHEAEIDRLFTRGLALRAEHKQVLAVIAEARLAQLRVEELRREVEENARQLDGAVQAYTEMTQS